jgi:hypothetical protein
MQNKDHLALDYGDCTKSRHTLQWYQQPLPLVHFSSDILMVALLATATIYHIKKGDKSK